MTTTTQPAFDEESFKRRAQLRSEIAKQYETVVGYTPAMLLDTISILTSYPKLLPLLKQYIEEVEKLDVEEANRLSGI